MMSNSDTLVTVLMPVYNAERYVSEAIESILNQTYRDFEFIIINDGSTDQSEEIIQRYNDSRIVYVRNERNIRLVATLNKGIRMASGKYIMRMDADDISSTDRMKLQVKFMELHPDVGVCGSFLSVFGETIKPYLSRRPENDEDIRSSMLVNNPLGHPNVIIRKSVLVKNDIWYDENYYRMEDWGLWISLMPYCKFYNIQKPLLRYRYVETSESRLNSKDSKHLGISANLVQLFFDKIGVTCNASESKQIAALIKSPHVFRLSKKEIRDSVLVLKTKLTTAEYMIPGLTEHTMERVTAFSLNKWYLMFLLIKKMGVNDYVRTAFSVLKKKNSR